MEPGIIVEYIDRQKIFSAVVMDIKNQRVRVLTQANREANISMNRLARWDRSRVNMSMGRDRLVEHLKEKIQYRNQLAETIDIQELWEVLNTEQEWIDLETMTAFCFPDEQTDDHLSATLRAFFRNRLYFKFRPDGFFPYTEEQVQNAIEQQRQAEQRRRLIEAGARWLKQALNGGTAKSDADESGADTEFGEILKSYYLFEGESPHVDVAREILHQAGVKGPDTLFQAFVRMGIWDPDENLDLYRMEIPVAFDGNIVAYSDKLISGEQYLPTDPGRKDLTNLALLTIDGQATLDFDDALSIERMGDHYRLGVHIADVAHYIKRGDQLDEEARSRGSSIYMPDGKIPMIPPELAEGLCSLKQGQLRPAISILIETTLDAEIIGYEIMPSLVRVQHQWTYHDVNMMVDDNPDIGILYEIAKNFRKRRLASGALQITLPEINIWLNEEGEPVISRTSRETPSRMLVAEIMIMANWLMAGFLNEHGVPAIYRSQPDPRERVIPEDGGTLYQNWMQRKLLSRFVLNHFPDPHSGLGLEVYVTATSPIRKYFDLVTQRQIRSVLGFEQAYSSEEIDQIILALQQPLSHVGQIQYRRRRYWLLKYLEQQVGSREEAIVLNRRKNNYLALLPEYLVECSLPLAGGIKLKPEDLVQVTIQHVNARKDVLAVYMS